MVGRKLGGLFSIFICVSMNSAWSQVKVDPPSYQTLERPNVPESPDCDTIRRLWNVKFREDIGLKWAQKEILCPSIDYQLGQALWMISRLKTGQTTAGNPGPVFYDFFIRAITSTRYKEELTLMKDDKVIPKKPPVFKIAETSDSGELTLFKMFFFPYSNAREKLSDPYRMAFTLIHEARHGRTDKQIEIFSSKDPGHAKCTQGMFKGYENTCDEALAEYAQTGGAYGMELYYAWWIRDASNANELYRKVSNAKMEDLVLNRFNTYTTEQRKKYIKD